MDFFKQQKIAKRKSLFLILLFMCSITLIIVIINCLILFILIEFTTYSAFNWHEFWMIGFFVLSIVMIGVIAKSIQLNRGGKAVAEMLGGTLLLPQNASRKEKKLLNIVEEMSLASGITLPPVYLLNEKGINAFAAGNSLKNAVIGITSGAVQSLSRDELQGVIAHEFSHIFHGDMALNMNVTKLIFGIEVISILGYEFVRPRTSFYLSNHRSSNKAYLIGIALMLVGSIGVLFGNMIRAAISRQREYLADASAVRYTRNPLGIANALKKIGGAANGSLVKSRHARQISHCLFSQGITSYWNTIFATHPPLDRRILQIDPHWDGEYISSKAESTQYDQAETTQNTISRRFLNDSIFEFAQETKPPIEFTSSNTFAPLAKTASNSVDTGAASGNYKSIDFLDDDEPNIHAARNLLTAIPQHLIDAAHNEFGARALVYSLLLNKDEHQVQQLRLIKTLENDAILQTTQALMKTVQNLDVKLRLPLIEMSIPSLHRQSNKQFSRMAALMNALILTDQKIDLFEWVLESLVISSLKPKASLFKTPFKNQSIGYKNIKSVRSHLSIIYSAIIHSLGQPSPKSLMEKAQEHFKGVKLVLVSSERITIELLNKAALEINRIPPLVKPSVLEAAVSIITPSDYQSETISRIPSKPEVIEMIRAFGALIDCPIPLLGLSQY